MSFAELSLASFLDDLASSSPAPGGGSVAALAGSLGAALVSMVGSLTIGKDKFKDVEPEVRALRARSETLRYRLLAYIEDDVAAFNGYSAAARLPKETAEQKSARSAAIQKALMNAVNPPMNIAKACVDVLDLCLPIAEKGNVQAVSDAGVGALMAEADRGLYGRWLFQRIVRLGWHPFLRINKGGTFCPDQPPHSYRPLTAYAPHAGTQWQGTGVAFKQAGSRLHCTLLAYWLDGMTDAWLILTDLPPSACDAAWYGLRAWIEQGFKITKRGGWQWQRTRMTDPDRASRLWLAVAVATLWLLSVGEEDAATMPEIAARDATVETGLSALPRRRKATCLRLKSVFRRGWCRLLAALLRHDSLPEGHLVPEPWPCSQPLAEVVVT